MKRFGFHPDQLYFNQRNSKKVRYLTHSKYGNLEVPKSGAPSKKVRELHENYQKRLDFEKYMNPKGLKPTITSSFKKPQQEVEFVNHEVMLMRSPKPYDKNIVSFRVNQFMSKPEIKQYLGKLYNLPIQRVNTANKIGKIMRNMDKNTQWRKDDWKKAIVQVDFEVDPDLQRNM